VIVLPMPGRRDVQRHDDHELATQEIHAVFPSPKLVPGKVSAFVAFLQGRFGERWWEQ
jgi:hypothetical protein